MAEDDPAVRALLAEALGSLGCRIVQAKDAGEALRALREEPPDLILSDPTMAGMDGLQFPTLARSHAPGVPLILITDPGQRKQPACPSAAPPRSAGATVRGLEGLLGALRRKASQLSLLTQFGAALRDLPAPEAALLPPGGDGRARTPAIGPLVHRSLDTVLRALSGDRAVLALTEDGPVQIIAARGRDSGRLPLEAVAARIQNGGRGQSWHGVLKGMPVVAAPLSIQGGLVGILCVARDARAATFTRADRKLLEAFSAETGVALENACLWRQLEQVFQETVTSLVVTLEARDKYTEGHSLRVAEYARAIAAGQGLSPAACEQVRTASLLHDLGKVGVRDEILDKPGRLTLEEWHVMRQHPILGWKILEPLGFLAIEAQGVRHHHEWFNGRGYPDGLTGEAIPLPARIIAVADAFDAMTTIRPYRPPRSLPEALAELRRDAGRQFDPVVVNTFEAWLLSRSRHAPAA